jgi:serine/threonine protein kinase
MCDKGGNILASGGFGCVFSPALKCKDESTVKEGTISKLMIEKYTTQEYDKIVNIREKLNHIPNYESYFLLKDFTVCQPAKLSATDLSNFTSKCKALKKNGIKKNNINNQLDKLLILNMPNGGLPVDDYIQKKGSFNKLLTTNELLIQLLENGILKMNDANVYHCDIKDSNVLVDSSNQKQIKMRLIDWGLATEYVPFQNNPFPKSWRNRPLQFNVPFSVILFTDDFITKYTEYIQKGGKIVENDLRPFIIDYIYDWFKERGPGHYRFINEIMYILFEKELPNISENEKYKLIENEFTLSYLINYLTQILIHFTKFREDGTLNLREYLDNVFINIVDIWGFISIYVPLLQIFHVNYKQLTAEQMKIFELLKHIFIHYLYSPRIEPIKINDLTKDLRKLSKLFRLEINIEDNNKNKKYITTKKLTTIKTSKLRFEKSTKKTKTKTRRFKSFLMLSTKNKTKQKTNKK